VIDEGSQLRHHLMAAGIVEKYTRRVYEFSRFCRSSSDRLRHLRKTHTFDGRAKQGRKVVGNQRPRLVRRNGRRLLDGSCA
jgi:hypothetical protein